MHAPRKAATTTRRRRATTIAVEAPGSARVTGHECCVPPGFVIPFRARSLTESLTMRDWFTFENLPLTLIVILIIMSWLSFFSVILFAG